MRKIRPSLEYVAGTALLLTIVLAGRAWVQRYMPALFSDVSAGFPPGPGIPGRDLVLGSKGDDGILRAPVSVAPTGHGEAVRVDEVSPPPTPPPPQPVKHEPFVVLMASGPGFAERFNLVAPPKAAEISNLAEKHGGRLLESVATDKMRGAAYWIAVSRREEGALVPELIALGLYSIVRLRSGNSLERAAAGWKHPDHAQFRYLVEPGKEDSAAKTLAKEAKLLEDPVVAMRKKIDDLVRVESPLANRYRRMAGFARPGLMAQADWPRKDALLALSVPGLVEIEFLNVPPPAGTVPVASNGKSVSCRTRVRSDPRRFSLAEATAVASGHGGTILDSLPQLGLYLVESACDAQWALEEAFVADKTSREVEELGVPEAVFPDRETGRAFCVRTPLLADDDIVRLLARHGARAAGRGEGVVFAAPAEGASMDDAAILREPGFAAPSMEASARRCPR